jgi:hypothetical protein
MDCAVHPSTIDLKAPGRRNGAAVPPWLANSCAEITSMGTVESVPDRASPRMPVTTSSCRHGLARQLAASRAVPFGGNNRWRAPQSVPGALPSEPRVHVSAAARVVAPARSPIISRSRLQARPSAAFCARPLVVPSSGALIANRRRISAMHPLLPADRPARGMPVLP